MEKNMSSEKTLSYEDCVQTDSLFYKFFKNHKFPVLILHFKTFKVLDTNNRAVDFFQFTIGEIKKKYLYSFALEKEQEEWKNKIDLHKTKSCFTLQMPMIPKNKAAVTCSITIEEINIGKCVVWAAVIDNENSEKIALEIKLKEQNKDLTEQLKKLVDINRKMVNSYENIKRQYQELLEYQEENVKTERHKTIGEMTEVLQDKINKPLNRILDDVQKIHDSEKKLDSSVVKRLKLIEESAENVLRIIDRISEVRDIKKMKYIELNNM